MNKPLLALALALACALALGASSSAFAKPRAAGEGAPVSSAADMPIPAFSFSLEETPARLHGVWTGTFHTVTKPGYYVEDPVTLQLFTQTEPRGLYLTIESSEAAYTLPASWSILESGLSFTVGDASWQIAADLRFENADVLSGTLTQYGASHPLRFARTDAVPADPTGGPRFVLEEQPEAYWLEQLRTYPAFDRTEGTAIPFTYALRRWDQSLSLINEYGLQQAVQGRSDVALMQSLLELTSQSFPHDGNALLPEQNDPVTVAAYCSQNGAVECRGLSIILAEMLRTAGIPAKMILCIPSTEPSADCHAVVHAYSQSLDQWVMLDPSYGLMLRNQAGQPVSLPMLRDALVSGEPLAANERAGHNGLPFYMDYYRAYMAKNCFRFSCATEFSCAQTPDENGSASHMLVPQGWSVPYAYSRAEQVTSNASAFWALPTL